MAKGVIKKATILLHDLDVSGLHNNIGLQIQAEEKECSNYASGGWREYLQGLLGTDIPLEGYLDTATNEPVLFDMLTPDTYYPMSVSLDRPLVAGSTVYFANVFLKMWQRRQQIGEIYGYSGQAQRQAPLIRGVALENLSEVETGDGTALDLGAALADGDTLHVAVHMFAMAGTSPTGDLVLESDVDGLFASPTTRLTIPQFTEPGSYYGTVAGPVTDEFWRITRTVGGTDTPTLTYVAEIGRMVLT